MVVFDVQAATQDGLLWGGIEVSIADDVPASYARQCIRRVSAIQRMAMRRWVALESLGKVLPEHEDQEQKSRGSHEETPEMRDNLAVLLAASFPGVAFPTDKQRRVVLEEDLIELAKNVFVNEIAQAQENGSDAVEGDEEKESKTTDMLAHEHQSINEDGGKDDVRVGPQGAPEDQGQNQSFETSANGHEEQQRIKSPPLLAEESVTERFQDSSKIVELQDQELKMQQGNSETEIMQAEANANEKVNVVAQDEVEDLHARKRREQEEEFMKNIEGEMADAELWFCKKPFKEEQPLNKQVKISAKTKLRVFLAPGDQHDCYSNDSAALGAATDAIKSALDTLPDTWKTFTPGPIANSTRTHAGSTHNSSQSNKRSRDDLDLSFMKGRGMDPAILKLCDEMGFRIKANIFKRLDGDTKIQNFMRDPRLVQILVDIEKSSKKMTTLEDCMDRDASFAQFVDRILETIGAQQVIERRDGSRSIESSLEEVIESTRPSFLVGAKSGSSTVDVPSDDDEDNEADEEDVDANKNKNESNAKHSDELDGDTNAQMDL